MRPYSLVGSAVPDVVDSDSAVFLPRRCLSTMKAISAITSNNARIPPMIPPIRAPFGELVAGTAAINVSVAGLTLAVVNGSASLSAVVVLADVVSLWVALLLSSTVELAVNVLVDCCVGAETVARSSDVVVSDATVVVAVGVIVVVGVVFGAAVVVDSVVSVVGAVVDAVETINEGATSNGVGGTGGGCGVAGTDGGCGVGSTTVAAGDGVGRGVGACVVIAADDIVETVDVGWVHTREPQLLAGVQGSGSGLESHFCRINPSALKITQY
jgi:hypothetical protein